MLIGLIMYTLHDFGDYKIIDSAQQLDKGQFKNLTNDSDRDFGFVMVSIDGGMIVSNDNQE